MTAQPDAQRWRVRISPQTRVIIAVAIAVLALSAAGRLRRLDDRFLQWSPRGAAGLTSYLTGRYRQAATAYRAHAGACILSGWRSNDPAWDLSLTGDLAAAEAAARETLQQDPANLNSLLTLGEIALRREQLAEALRQFELVLERDANQFDALMLCAVALTRGRDDTRAIEFMKRAFRTNTAESSLTMVSQTRLAWLMLARGWLGSDGRLVRALTALLRPVRDIGRITVVLEALQTAGELSERPDGQRPLCLLAHYHRFLRIYDDLQGPIAISYARRAIAAKDRQDDAYVTIGVVDEKAGRRARALQMFLKAAEVNPRNAEALRWAAFLYSERGDLLRQHRMIMAAFDAAPEDPFYLSHLEHLLLEQLGDPHQALAVFQRALAVDPNNVRALDRSSHCYAMLGEYERAADGYRRAIQLNPLKVELYEGLGFALSRDRKIEEAVTAFQTAAAIAPGRPEPRARLAHLYFDQSRTEDAINAYEESFALGNTDVDDLAHLCALYHYAGSEAERAEACFERVLERDPDNTLANRLLPEVQHNLRLKRARDSAP